mmetsp:Transcript_3336/g.7864  ORF Transcript_3336/g.7864 Transcript_3336/m.7864 type:complete len:213 (-) Transcript_3336:923-1561(-)
MHGHLIDSARWALAAHDSIYKLRQCHFSITIIQKVKQGFTFMHIQIQCLKEGRHLGISQNLGQPLFRNQPTSRSIDGLKQVFQFAHVVRLFVHFLNHEVLRIILSCIQSVLQEDRTDDADQCEDDDRDVNHEKYRVKLADLVEDWSSIRRPIPCKSHFINRVCRAVSRAIQSPHLHPVVVALSWIDDEGVECISHYHGAHKDKDAQQDHGPK